ncbi:MAG: cupin domain-containing protein [Chitinophagaceae bacterium]|nr:MAG: cupin domain-containing protein [Chitinophagaceae bacterium]
MKKDRRQFLKTAGFSTVASTLPFVQLLAGSGVSPEPDKEGFVIDAESQETYLIAGRQAPVTIIVDKQKKGVQAISFCFEDIIPGDLIPVHKHLREAEVIFIQKGSGVFTLGEKEFAVKEGSAAYVPKGVWHGLRNTGTETIRMQFSFTPAGFEGYFREIGVPIGVEWKEKTPQEFAAIDKKYGIVYKPKKG